MKQPKSYDIIQLWTIYIWISIKTSERKKYESEVTISFEIYLLIAKAFCFQQTAQSKLLILESDLK